MTRAWISAGTNVDPEANLRAAIASLRREFGELLLSPVYQTRAVGFEGDDFLNMVVGIDTGLPPHRLRARLREIETRQGRVRGEEKFAPRSIDLDLLTWGDLVDEAAGIPRDEILRYAFVLKPLADVAGAEKHPGAGHSYQQLWRRFQGRQTDLVPLDWEWW
ncbi:2-amino-4-hydroxy-6-hydroxymethyldihydropteridine diphosphokinase [Thiolapillus sp.]